MSDNQWESLITFSDSKFSFLRGGEHVKPWIRDIITRLHAIESHSDFFLAISAIHQKIGMVRESIKVDREVYYSSDVCNRLETTLKVVTKTRVEKIQQEVLKCK